MLLWSASFKSHIWHTAFVLSSLNLKCSHTAEVLGIFVFTSELNHDVHDIHSWAIHIQARMIKFSRGIPGVKKKRIFESQKYQPIERIIEYSGPALLWMFTVQNLTGWIYTREKLYFLFILSTYV